MFFKKKFLIVFVSTFLFTSLAFAESNVQFGGYARAGFGLNLSKFNRSYASLGEGSFASRHVRDFNYMQLDLTKNFDNGSKLAFSVDSEDFQNVHYENVWDTTFRVRNAYYNVPVSDSVDVWAGVRYFLFSDIRLIDYLLDYKAIGAGATLFKNTDVFISVDKKNGKKEQGPRDLTLAAHSTIDLNSTVSISPEVQVTRYTGGSQTWKENPNEAAIDVDIDAHIGFLVRTLVGLHSDSWWNNTFVSYEQQPLKYSDETVKTISVGDSGSFRFADAFGLLVGALFKYEKYSTELQVYDKGVAKEGEGKKSRVQASVDVQPVYFMTDHVQLALDLNKTIRTEYFEAWEKPAALYITPIVRYSFNKDTIANAQIYTSLTYSKFDWDGIYNGKELNNNLISMQTGFEIAF